MCAARTLLPAFNAVADDTRLLAAFLDPSNDENDVDFIRKSISTLSGRTALTFLKRCGEMIDMPASYHRQNCIKLQESLLAVIQRDDTLLTTGGTFHLMDQFGVNISCDVFLVTMAIGNLRTMNELDRCAFVFEATERLRLERGRDQLLRFLAALVTNYWCSDMSEYASDLCTLVRFGESDYTFKILGALVDNLTPNQIVEFDIVKQVTANFSGGQVALFFALLRKIDASLSAFPDLVPECLVDVARVLLLSGDSRDFAYCKELCVRLASVKVAWELRAFIVENPRLWELYKRDAAI